MTPWRRGLTQTTYGLCTLRLMFLATIIPSRARLSRAPRPAVRHCRSATRHWSPHAYTAESDVEPEEDGIELRPAAAGIRGQEYGARAGLISTSRRRCDYGKNGAV
jgi:hypothetical protein